MSTTIFYFSGSGNSLAIAKAIGSKIGNCTMKPVVKAMAEKDFTVKTEKVGFVFPLYYLGLPKIVQEFIKEVDLEGANFIFTVVTKGWPVVGGAIDQLKQFLKVKKRKLDAGMYVRMPSNDITFTKVDPPVQQKKIMAKAEAKIIRICETISNAAPKHDLELIWFLWPLRNGPFINRVNRDDRSFSVGIDCNGCGSCARVCPLDNIKITDHKPQWLGRCQQCLACYHFCPSKTIFYRGQQANGLQYHHPDVGFEEIAGQKAVLMRDK